MWEILKVFEKNIEYIVLKDKYTEQLSDIRNMFAIQRQVVETYSKDIKIDATNCTYISPTCLIVLMSTLLIGREDSKRVTIIAKRNSKILNKLQDYGYVNISAQKNIKNIPLNLIVNDDQANEVIGKLINLSPLNDLNEAVKVKLHSRLFEIPNNAIQHSESKVGALCCGYYRNRNEFWFSIYDLGKGIPSVVKNYLKDESMRSEDAIKWALKSGNTTKETDYTRGLGFSLLEELREMFNGKILLISEDIVYTSKSNSFGKYTSFKTCIPGTLYTIKIVV